MQELDWFRAYVERILEDVWNQPRLVPDDDGAYPFRYGTAACYVRIEPGPPMTVRVFAQAVTGVRKSAKLLAELNDFNASARSLTGYWDNGRVIVDEALLASATNAESLTRACADAGQAAHDMGTLLAAMFDGRTPFRHEDCVEEHRRDE